MNIFFFFLQGVIKTVANVYLIRYLQNFARATRKRNANRNNAIVYGPIKDLTHEITDPLYVFITHRQYILNIIIVLLAIHINFCVFILLYQSIFSKSVPLIIASVFFTKALFNIIYQSPAPVGRENPKIGHNRRLHWSPRAQKETFFSGHTSLCALAISFSPTPLKPYIVIGSIFTILMIIILRVHYIIDIAGGLLVVYFYTTIL